MPKSENRDIAAPLRGNTGYRIEHAFDTLQISVVPVVRTPKIDNQNTLIGQRLARVGIEILRAKFGNLLSSIVAIDHEDIAALPVAGHPCPALCRFNRKTRVVRREMKILPGDRNYFGFDFDDRGPGTRQMLVDEFSQRAATQPDHEHMLRVRAEQQE